MGLPFLSFNGPGIPFILAQNDFLLAALLPVGFFSVTGACKLLPVARLYFALPLAVSPPFRDFSPRPTDKLTPRQKTLLSKHSEHHSAKHMEFMKRRMRAGDTFTQAHKKAQAKVGK